MYKKSDQEIVQHCVDTGEQIPPGDYTLHQAVHLGPGQEIDVTATRITMS